MRAKPQNRSIKTQARHYPYGTIHAVIRVTCIASMFLLSFGRTWAQSSSPAAAPQPLVIYVQPQASHTSIVTAHAVDSLDLAISQVSPNNQMSLFEFTLDSVTSGDKAPLVRFDAPAHLACFIELDRALQGSTIILTAGDINHDDVIDDRDSAAIGSSHRSGEMVRDVNQDDQIDIRDLTYIGRNYGAQAGPCQVEPAANGSMRLLSEAPFPREPEEDFHTTDPLLTLEWDVAAGATAYDVRLDTMNPPQTEPVSTGSALAYTPMLPLVPGVYFWQVRAVGAKGSVSAWSDARSFTVEVSSIIVEEIITPTPTMTPTPTQTPAALQGVDPAVPPTVTSENLLVIEAESGVVTRMGTWLAYDTNVASGGRYIFSSGVAGDALALAFTGAKVTINFVKHPALGTFGIEIDGVQAQTVVSTSEEIAFGMQVTVDNLTPGPHVLLVHATEGTIALDAFIVQAVVVPSFTPIPTEISVSPTLPSQPATVEATFEPTVTPVSDVLALPVNETFDSGLNWTPTGSWVPDAAAARSGLSWFASSAVRDQSNMLTASYLIDLRTAQYPLLTFWQKMNLSSGDMVGIDLSLDGDPIRYPFDEQQGTVIDWTLRSLDLSAYRGQVIRLHLHLDTPGIVPNGETTTGYWVDDLAVVDVLPTLETAVPLETDAPAATATILPTQIPFVTATPLPTEPPGPTATATVTSTVTSTQDPLPTDLPISTATATVTSTVMSTQDPLPKDLPISTATATVTSTQPPLLDDIDMNALSDNP